MELALAGAVTDRERALAGALEGELLLQEDEVAAAIASLERAVELDPALEGAEPQVADALGRAYVRANDYERAVGVFRRNFEAATVGGDQLRRARFGALLANAYSDSADFAAAEALLGVLVANSAEVVDPLARARIFWSQSRLHARKKEGDSAAHYAELALDVLELSDQSRYAALAHLLLAHIELDRDNPQRALELLEEAEPLVSGSGRPAERANLQLERARAYALVGRQDEAVSLAAAAGPLLEQTTLLEAGRGYALMAKVFAAADRDSRAIELYEEAIERLEVNPSRYLIEAYSELANLYQSAGQPERAIELLRRAVNVQSASDRVLV